MAFRGEDITEDEIKRLEPIVGDEGFTVENMKSKSAAAANLCSWVISIYTFNRIYVKVRSQLWGTPNTNVELCSYDLCAGVNRR